MLRLYRLTILLVKRLAPYVRQIEARDPDLARQMRRALTSVPLNVAEGMDARGTNRVARYDTALGSETKSSRVSRSPKRSATSSSPRPTAISPSTCERRCSTSYDRGGEYKTSARPPGRAPPAAKVTSQETVTVTGDGRR
jgi:hypothetical protein